MNETIKTLSIKNETKALAAKAKLTAEQDKIVKLEASDLIHFISQSYFANDGVQLYLTLQPVVSLKSEGLLIEKLTTPTTADNSLSPSIKWYGDSKCV